MAVYHLPSEALEEQNYFYIGAEDGTELLVVPQGCKDLPNRFDGLVYLPWETDAILSAPITPKTLIPESLADTFPQNPVLISSQICGGTLKKRLQDALEHYGARLFFLIEPLGHSRPLPCPNAEPLLISHEESNNIRSRLSSFYTNAFCCQYCVDIEANAVHLFDTPLSVDKKIDLAQSLGITNILVLPT
ncbi:MAG: hypothetical protein IIY04_04400 [Oscillospiraceae bacterium]|nr:hypothetical protein [Oscillospiraceae bacterium]